MKACQRTRNKLIAKCVIWLRLNKGRLNCRRAHCSRSTRIARGCERCH
jgi:hypothetical protein